MIKSNLFIKYYKSIKPIYKFFINGLILYLIWLIFYEFFKNLLFISHIYEYGTVFFRDSLLYGTYFFLKIISFASYVDTTRETLHILGAKAVWVGRGCMGRNLMGLFAGFIVAYPGKLKSKLFFIPIGIFVIFLINIVRIGGLAIILKCCPENLDFNHHILFKYTVYFFIFLMWVFWVKNYSHKK